MANTSTTPRLVVAALDPGDTSSWYEFVKVQYAAFKDNNLHDHVYPVISPQSPQKDVDAAIEHTIERHRSSCAQKPDEQVTFAVVRDQNSSSADGKGSILAGIKWCFYEDEKKTHPVTAECSWYPDGSREKELADRVLDDFMSRRSARMSGQHASEY